MFERIYSIAELGSLEDIAIDYLEFYKIYGKNMWLYPKEDHIKWIGHYRNNEDSDVSDFDQSIKRHFFYDGSNMGISQTSISHVDSIIAICQKHKVELIVVGTPVYKEYYARIPSNIIDRFEIEKERLIGLGLPFIDLINVDYEEDDYRNSDHLNEKGAKRFTLETMELLAKLP